MPQLRLRAAFMRGGTSKAIVFRAADLPADRDLWPDLFRAAIGSPDPNGRQLDGLGGGVSSLSKICIVGPPSRADADLDYTFAQIGVRDDRVDLAGNCGNMSAAIGPFAVDEGLVPAAGDEAAVRIHNTNTGKIIVARFPLENGRAAVEGGFALPGVAGTGAPVRLEFLDPGGAATGRLLPTGRPVDRLDLPGSSPVEASLVDAGNACVFVRAGDLGLTGRELPEAIEARPDVLVRLEALRRAASVAMGIAAGHDAAGAIASIPKIAVVAPPADAPMLSGGALAAADHDIAIRMISVGQPHRAVPLTGALCLAVASRIDGSIPHAAVRAADGPLRIGQPSGVTVVDAVMRCGGGWAAESAVVYRSQRRLMDGHVYVPESRVPGLAAALRQAAE